MLKRLKIFGVALAATLFMAASANAAVLIDFRDAAGVVVGGTVQYSAGDAVGTGIGIGQIFIDGAAAFNGVHDVTGTNSGFGELRFNTIDNTISISGCIADLGVGIVEGNCAPVDLMLGTITEANVVPNLFGVGFITLGGLDAKNGELLTAIGLDPNTPFSFFGSDITTVPNVNGTAKSVSVDIANTPIPEPTTMMLLGTGLLAAFRARRRQ